MTGLFVIVPGISYDEEITGIVSYRKSRDRNTPEVALNLVARLKDYDYETFIDLERLEGGLEWEQEIYSNISAATC